MLDALLLRVASPIGIVAIVGLAMIAIERIRPGRQWPRVAGWWPRALALNTCQIVTVWLAGVVWDGWMQFHQVHHSPQRIEVITAACPVLPVALRARFDG
jgi:sterol desaturase/sphingolipid hydroxylase (fatty acid hydroxylase superfamily)